jgi:nickel-type superoxide dismutase maturation protease
VLPLTRVRIVGPSMEPAVRTGEWWIARRGGRPRLGDVVLMQHPRRADLLIVKRLVRREIAAWWVLGDNPASSEDSRDFGPVPEVNVIGRLVFRYGPVRRR